MRLPGGFSPVNAIKQGVSNATHIGRGGADYDVFGDVSVRGGARSPANGAFIGPQVLGASTGGGGGAPAGDGAGGGTAGASGLGGGAFYDPMAAARAAFSSRLGSAIGNIRTSGADAFGSAGRNLRGQAEQLYNTIKQGQGGIDRSRENIELNRLAGVDDILSFVRNGLKSGASMLSNKNALGSSAAQELAQFYGGEGTSRTRKVSNKAFLENRDVDTQQDQLNLQKGQGRTDWARTRDDMVSNIGQQVRSQLAELQDQALEVGASGPEVEAERQRIIDGGIGQLNEIDAWLAQVLGEVNPQDTATTKKNAVALRQGGLGEVTPFDFGEFQSPQLQGGGPQIAQLPIFTRPRNDEF